MSDIMNWKLYTTQQ